MTESKRITAEGLKKLQDELNYRMSAVRSAIANEIDVARSYGDLSENAEYTEAKNLQTENETRIAFLQERLKLAGMKWYLSTAESLLALRSKLKSDLWEIEVVPLVRVQYNKWHLQKDNVRAKQRDSHRKNRKSV